MKKMWPSLAKLIDMLSPRQRVFTPKVEPNNKNTSSHEIFKNRKFYLDIKSKYPASLVKDLKDLGGVSITLESLTLL